MYSRGVSILWKYGATKLKIAEAGLIAADLLYGEGNLERHFANWKICGSIRRLCENVGDIDIVAIPKPESEYLFAEVGLNEYINRLDPEGRNASPDAKRFLLGDKIKRFWFRGIMIDIYMATEKTFETLMLIRTGSREHNVRLTTLAMSKNMKLKAGGEGLVARNNEAFIYEDTEDGILMKLLGRVPPPDQRN